jgi:hypothetical protein
LLAELYRRRGDTLSAIRCLERTVLIDAKYNLPDTSRDSQEVDRLKNCLNQN